MNIDLRTLILIMSITSILQIIVLWIQYRVNKIYHGVGWWLLGFSSIALGYGFLFLRDLIAIKLITIIFANTLALLGFIFIYTGIMRFLDRKENSRMIITIFKDEIIVRTIIVYTTFSTVSFITAFLLPPPFSAHTVVETISLNDAL